MYGLVNESQQQPCAVSTYQQYRFVRVSNKTRIQMHVVVAGLRSSVCCMVGVDYCTLV